MCTIEGVSYVCYAVNNVPTKKGVALTGFHTYATRPRVGRTKEWEKRLTLPLTSEMVERLDAAREPGEDRLTVIRKGIERELKARARQKVGKRPED